MRDRLTKARRSWNMSRIRGKNTEPEMVVRSLLHRLAYRFRSHARHASSFSTTSRAKPWILLSILFVFASSSLRAQAPANSTFSLAPGDVTEAAIDHPGRARLQVTLTPEKTDELSAFTGRNLNKQIRIVVCDRLRSEPFVREHMAGPSMEIFVSSPEDALATVKCLLTSHLSFDQLYKCTNSSGIHYSDKPPVPSSDQRHPALRSTNGLNQGAFKELQGSWTVVKATMNGKEIQDPSIHNAEWTFQNNELILLESQKPAVRFAVEIDGKAEPKAFHLTPIEPAKERSGWILFSREKNSLKIAFHDNLEGRPESFSDSQLIVATLAPKK
jgi:uncharacterized protein (TIGR03067 family)